MRVSPKLDRQQVDHGIEPDDELAAFALDRLGDAVAERRGHDRPPDLEVLRHRKLR
jgi:hypothetical protein